MVDTLSKDSILIARVNESRIIIEDALDAISRLNICVSTMVPQGERLETYDDLHFSEKE